VKLLKNWGDVLYGWCVSNDTCSRILNKLEFTEGFLWKTIQERITIIDSGSDKAMHKNSSGERSDSRM